MNYPSHDDFPISCWNTAIDWVIESDQEAEDLESQSQDLDSHSLTPAQCNTPRDVHMAEVEKSFHQSGESFNDPQVLISEA